MSRPALTSETDPPNRKATLFCPACGHDSPTDGDWIVRQRARSVGYHCPDCGERITERHRDESPIERAWSAWLRAASEWLRPPRRLRA